jgi:hypothetical protein
LVDGYSLVSYKKDEKISFRYSSQQIGTPYLYSGFIFNSPWSLNYASDISATSKTIFDSSGRNVVSWGTYQITLQSVKSQEYQVDDA